MASFTPSNEMGVIALFWTRASEAGWEPVSLGTAYPDAVLRKEDQVWRVEFEFRSHNFSDHEHDVRECDLIICWEDNWRQCPLPVLELRNPQWAQTVLQRVDPKDLQTAYWKMRAYRAERRRPRFEKEPEDSVQQLPRMLPPDLTEQIVRYLIAHPGAKQEEIAKALGVSVPSVSREMKSLAEREILHIEKVGTRRVASVNGGHQQFLAS